jgi:hypothetical protein
MLVRQVDIEFGDFGLRPPWEARLDKLKTMPRKSAIGYKQRNWTQARDHDVAREGHPAT